MTIKEAYELKGQLITQIEVAQMKLKEVNEALAKFFAEQAQPKPVEKQDEPATPTA